MTPPRKREGPAMTARVEVPAGLWQEAQASVELDNDSQMMTQYDADAEASALDVERLAGRIAAGLKGGQGSGNFGHAGRPGEVGGSGSGGGVDAIPITSSRESTPDEIKATSELLMPSTIKPTIEQRKHIKVELDKLQRAGGILPTEMSIVQSGTENVVTGAMALGEGRVALGPGFFAVQGTKYLGGGAGIVAHEMGHLLFSRLLPDERQLLTDHWRAIKDRIRADPSQKWLDVFPSYESERGYIEDFADSYRVTLGLGEERGKVDALHERLLTVALTRYQKSRLDQKELGTKEPPASIGGSETAGDIGIADIVFLAFMHTGDDAQRLADMLFGNGRDGYEERIRQELLKLDCTDEGVYLREEGELSWLRAHCDQAAVGITGTYNRDLRNAIDGIIADWQDAHAGSLKGLNRNVMAKRVKDWDAERNIWKAQQIATTEMGVVDDRAILAFADMNSTGGRARVMPEAAVCNVCKSYVAMGWLPLFRAGAVFDIPAHVNCLPGNALVMASGGGIPIADIALGTPVYGKDAELHKVTAKLVRTGAIWECLFMIEFDDRRLVASADHPVWTRRGWKAAKKVKEGDQVLCFHADGLDWQKVSSVSLLFSHQSALYDLEVEGESYFANGVCVHNCPHELETELEGVPDCAELWRGGTGKYVSKELGGSLKGLGQGAEWQGKEAAEKGGQGSGNFGHAGRPGEVGGSAGEGGPGGADNRPWARQLPPNGLGVGERNMLRLAEQDGNEHAANYDANGNPLRLLSGTSNSIAIPFDVREEMAGGAFTHTHPAGRSFSIEDGHILCVQSELREIRAVSMEPQLDGHTYLYRLSRKAGTETISKDDYLKKYGDADHSVRARFLPAIDKGTMTINEANAGHHREVWKRLAPELGLVYEEVVIA